MPEIAVTAINRAVTPASLVKGHHRAMQQVQVIDFGGSFHPEFESHLKRLGLTECGFRYNVITVLGCQSSGKSTLLNSLFGTMFPEMNAMQGRSQTTKGIWASKDVNDDTLIIDVEGTDSKERGEDRLTFEHRASLFSLAIADAVIVNMWYNDLGRYSASNYGLLKTVLAVNLELFHQEPDTKKTTMIFVIRDFSVNVTPLHVLNNMLMMDLNEIWSDIKKPKEHQQSRLADFFDFVVFGMPSKITDLAGYETGVQELRERWHQLAPKSYSRRVPADGFSFFAKQVWMSILSSSELDIPSQKEMVATFRCEEIRQATLAIVLPRIQSHAHDPPQLFDGGIAQDAVIDAIKLYHKDAWRYQEAIYFQKRKQLLDSVFAEIQKPLEKFMFQARQHLIKDSASNLDDMCKRSFVDPKLMMDGSSCVDFWKRLNDLLERWKETVLNDFDAIGSNARIDCVVEITDHPAPIKEEIKHTFDFSIIRSAMEESLVLAADKVLAREQVAVRKFIEGQLDGLRPQMEKLMINAKCHQAFWKSITNMCAKMTEQLYHSFGDVLLHLRVLDEKATNAVELNSKERLALLVTHRLRETIVERPDRIPDLVHKRFSANFEEDEKGAPHHWPSLTQDRITALYVAAKQRGEALMGILDTFDVELSKLVSTDLHKIPDATLREISKVTPNSTLSTDTLQSPLFTEGQRLEIFSSANTRMLKSCKEAQFYQAMGGKPFISSFWWWFVVLALGFNEIMAVLRSPVFSILMVTAVAVFSGAYYTRRLGLLMDLGRRSMSLGLGFVIPLISQITVQDAPPPSHVETTSSGRETSD